ncbi:hypothetical protein [Effusibacillus consociatus]|uniref:Uncharacterized protein n=1 Tax=Effusibacillus consociatus TaxID=1117041 RepID=A0ABV9PZ09_9BACL
MSKEDAVKQMVKNIRVQGSFYRSGENPFPDKFIVKEENPRQKLELAFDRRVGADGRMLDFKHDQDFDYSHRREPEIMK